jgi:hypothetical protein
MGFSPLIQPSPPGWLTLTGSGLGQSNRPSPFCPAHSSLSLSLSLELSLRRAQIASPSPGDSGHLRRPLLPPPWAKCSPLRPLPPPPNRFGRLHLSEEIQSWIPLRFRRPLSPLSSTPRRISSRCLLHGVWVAERHRWKPPRWVLPVLQHHRRWRLPSAMPGRPRGHCLAMPARYAPGRLVSVVLLLFLCLLFSGLWPSGHEQLRQAHRLGSVKLLLMQACCVGFG